MENPENKVENETEQIAAFSYKIEDLESFNKVIGEPRQVAGLYFYYMLDCLVDLANKVSHDFLKRPHLYTDLRSSDASMDGATFAQALARLHTEYGANPQVLNHSQRKVIYSALFGHTAGQMMDEDGDFPRLRDELFEACATYVETKFGDNDSLRINVRQKHRLFKEYLIGLQGDSVEWSQTSLSFLTEEISYAILRNRGVAAVFSGAKAPKKEWPYDFDSNADKTMEQISKQLMWPDKPAEMDMMEKSYMYITRENITNRQRAAIEGAIAIATAMDINGSSSDADINLLIRRCYTWYTALKSLKDYPSIAGWSPPKKAGMGGVGLAQPMPVAANKTS